MKTSNKLLLGLLLLILVTITAALLVLKYELRNTNFSNKYSNKNNGWFFNTSARENIHKGNGKQTEEKREVSKFNQLEIQNNIIVNYTQNASQSITVRADKNLSNLVVTEVHDKKLYIRLSARIEKDQNIEVDIVTDSITDVALTDGAIFKTTKKIYITNFSANATAGGIFNVDGDFNNIKINMSTGGIANFKGTCKKLKSSGSTGSILNAESLITHYGLFDANTGAIIKVNVSDEINIDASTGALIKTIGKGRAKKVDISSGGQFIH